MPPIELSPLQLRLKRVSMAMNMNGSGGNSEESTTTRRSGGGSAWKNRFSGLSALVQPQQLPFRGKELEGDEEEEEEEAIPGMTQLDRQDSLHILFSSSFSNIYESEDEEDDDLLGDEEKQEEEKVAEEPVEDHAMHILQKVQETLAKIFQCLTQWGIPSDLMEELYAMEKRLQYTALLKKAEEYTTQYLLHSNTSGSEEEILELFVSAWNYVKEYSHDRYQQIQKVYSELQWKQWQQQVTKFSQEKDQDLLEKEEEEAGAAGLGGFGFVGLGVGARHQQSQSQTQLHLNPAEEKSMVAIKEQLASAVRFKMECQKQCILTQEWTTSITRRRRQLEQQQSKQQALVTPPQSPKPKPTQKQKQNHYMMTGRMASFNNLNGSHHGRGHLSNNTNAIVCRQ